MIFLGGIWPSIYTIIAITVLPAFFIFLIGIVRPSFFYKPYFLGLYLIYSIVVSVGGWISEVIWLIHIGAKIEHI